MSVVEGDSRYDELYTKWQSEGSPGQFEELGTFGYRRWTVRIQDDGTTPEFMLNAAAGPTSTGYDEDTGQYKHPSWKGPQTGWVIEQQDCGVKVTPGPAGEGDIRIKMTPPPKDRSV